MSPTEDMGNSVQKEKDPAYSSGSIQTASMDPASQTPPDMSFKQKEDESSSPSSTSIPDSSPRDVHGWRWALAAISLYIGAFVYGLDGTIAADIQSAVVEQFGHVESLTWIGTGFPLGSVCFILPGSAIYEIFDQKAVFIGSIIIFEAASALCGAAPNMDALIVGRTIAGVGGCGIFLGIINYFTLCTAEQVRGRYISGMGATWGLGAVLGPVVGGAFSTSPATWRWAFKVSSVIAAVCAPVYIFYLPSVKPTSDTQTPILRKLKSLDWVGFVIGTAAIVTFVMVLTFAGSTWAWNDGRTIATFVVSGALFILTFVQQYFLIFTTREARMFPPQEILIDRTQTLLYLNTAMAATNIYVPLFYIPIYFAFTQGDTALMAAVRLLPFICFLASWSLLSGFLIPKINYYWVSYMVGGVLMLVGSATMFTVGPHTPIANVYGYSIILGAGTGFVFNLGFTVAGVTMMTKTGSGLDVQRVLSMQNLSQLGFQTICLLVGGQIFQSLSMKDLTRILSGMGFSESEIRSAVAGTASTLFESLDPALQEQAIAAITNAMSRVYILSIAAGAITIIVALLLKKEKLFQGKEDVMVIAGGA